MVKNNLTFVGNKAFECTGSTNTRIFGYKVIINKNDYKCLLLNHYSNHNDFKELVAHSHIHYVLDYEVIQ